MRCFFGKRNCEGSRGERGEIDSPMASRGGSWTFCVAFEGYSSFTVLSAGPLYFHAASPRNTNGGGEANTVAFGAQSASAALFFAPESGRNRTGYHSEGRNNGFWKGVCQSKPGMAGEAACQAHIGTQAMEHRRYAALSGGTRPNHSGGNWKSKTSAVDRNGKDRDQRCLRRFATSH